MTIPPQGGGGRRRRAVSGGGGRRAGAAGGERGRRAVSGGGGQRAGRRTVITMTATRLTVLATACVTGWTAESAMKAHSLYT